MLCVLAAALVVLGISWWLPFVHTSESTNARGALAPFLFAFVCLLLASATFAPAPKKSRSDQIMERARNRRRAPRTWRNVVVPAIVLVVTTLIVVAVLAIVLR